jgi:hypothetical protein
MAHKDTKGSRQTAPLSLLRFWWPANCQLPKHGSTIAGDERVGKRRKIAARFIPGGK